MSMKVINVHEAKTNFSKLLSRVENGERIIIGKSGKAVARLEPFSNSVVVHRKFKGGSLVLQAKSTEKLTPEYLDQIAKSKYGS